MSRRDNLWQKFSKRHWIGMLLGSLSGSVVGAVLCVAYNIIYGPWFPQAGVDPQPAGWIGWWIAGGSAIGAVWGLIFSIGVFSFLRLTGKEAIR